MKNIKKGILLTLLLSLNLHAGECYKDINCVCMDNKCKENRKNYFIDTYLTDYKMKLSVKASEECSVKVNQVKQQVKEDMIEETQNLFDKLHKENMNLESFNKELSKDNIEKGNLIADLTKTKEKLMKNEIKNKQKIKLLNESLENAKRNNNILREENLTITNKIKLLEEQNNKLRNKINILNGKIKTLTEKLNKKDKEINNLKVLRKTEKDKISVLLSQLNSKNKEISKLKTVKPKTYKKGYTKQEVRNLIKKSMLFYKMTKEEGLDKAIMLDKEFYEDFIK